MLRAIALLLAVAVATPAQADCRVPKERRVRSWLTVASNAFGPGVVNTAFGIVAIVGSVIAAPLSKKVQLPRFARSPSRSQISVTIGDDWYAWGTSLGLFVIEGRDPEKKLSREEQQLHALHESGHAAQSALLGPLYLPAVAVDYAIHAGGNHKFYFQERENRGGFSRRPEDDAWIEGWADSIAAVGGRRDGLSREQIAALIGCID